MRVTLCILFFISLVSCQNEPFTKVGAHDRESNLRNNQWSLADELQLNKNRNDTTLWSAKIWTTDTGDLSMKGKPMLQSVFPVPNYELVPNKFEGLGNGGSWKGVSCTDKKIIYHSLFVTKDYDRKRSESKATERVYFTIAVLTDFIDTERYSHTYVYSTSRNHPHYAGEGFIKTKDNRVDFMAFLTEDDRSYAMVNMRLFDLRAGSVVLIAPQTDGSFRSMQLEAPGLTSNELDKYIERMLQKNNTVIDFFTAEGCI